MQFENITFENSSLKKLIRCTLLAVVLCALLGTIAFAYGTATFVENGVTYTATDHASVYYSGANNDTICVDASCKINPTIRHYSTADIRLGSRTGTVVATSGRQWTDGVTSSASCSAPRSRSDLKGFGWWGH